MFSTPDCPPIVPLHGDTGDDGLSVLRHTCPGSLANKPNGNTPPKPSAVSPAMANAECSYFDSPSARPNTAATDLGGIFSLSNVPSRVMQFLPSIPSARASQSPSHEFQSRSSSFKSSSAY